MTLPNLPNINQGQIALDPVNGIVYYKDDNNNTVATTWSWLQNRNDEQSVTSEKNVSIEQDLTVGGNLVIAGDTVSINVSEVLIEDNILVLNHNFTGAPILNAGIEIERGSESNVQIRWNELDNKWQFTNDGTTYLDLSSIIENSVTLGLHTTGDYTKNLVAGTGVTISNNSGEGATPNISIGQAVATSSTVTFAGVTAPLTGNVTGNLTGDVTGDVTGTVSDISNHGIDGLSDVVVTSPLQFQGLMYDGTNWVNGNIPNTYLVRNNTGSTLLKGTLVGAVGAEPSGRIDVAPFEVTGGQDSELRAMGIVVSNISNGVNGEVISFGTLTGLDTRGSTASPLAVGDETWAAGDILFAHPTVNGKLTNVRPQHDLAVAFITVRHASTGQIAIRIIPGNNHLEWMHDVSLVDKTSGDFLKYNGTAWVNDAVNLTSDTVGDYVAKLAAGSGITITNNSGEGATPNIAIDTSIVQTRVANITDTEIGYLDGVTSGVQAQLDSKQPTFTGYDYEIHVSQVDGNDTTGNGDILNPVATITKALTLVTSSRRTVIVHPGGYTESPSITTQFTTITGPGLIGGNIVVDGTISTNTGCTISGIKMTNLTVTTPTAQGNVNILNCEISGTFTKSSNADYTVARLCDFGAVSITGAGLVAIFGGNPNFVTVNNASANVIVKSAVAVAPVLTAGTLSLVDSVVPAAVTNAVTSAASSFITLANCQLLTSALNNVAPVVLNGFYSILNCVYDKPSSTLAATSGTGGTSNSIDYFQYINAEKFITQGGTSSQYVKGDGSLDSVAYAPLATPTFTGMATIPQITVGGIEIDTTSPADTNVLKYSSLLNKYIPGVASTVASLDDLTDVAIAGATPNHILKWDGSQWINAEVPGTIGGTTKFETIGNGVDETFTITHNLSTRDIVVSISENVSPYGAINTTWEATTENTITIYFSDAPASSSVRVSIYAAVSGALIGPEGPAGPAGPEGPPGTVSTSVLDDLSDVVLTGATPNNYLQYNGSQWINSNIDLGTNTTGNYVKNLVEGTGISITNNSGEGATPNIAVSSIVVKTTDTGTVTDTMLATGVARAAFRSTLNPQTGTSYTLELTDLAKLITLSNTSAITLTIPLESSVAFAIGDRIDILQSNTGQVTIAGAGGVTVNATPGLKLRARWSSATLIKLDTNSWVVIGDMQA